ncbi:6933_t:CDS:2 [Ambispora leptoticha]|uniref:Large ribosomal subunit protein uL4m n=1 Tax=Ambispora leptoticha TaxID=144679 RepID=A0A9N8V4L2_9GLOM|nr:6933_t:CDS:2 [Ambispora leptoticha]
MSEVRAIEVKLLNLNPEKVGEIVEQLLNNQQQYNGLNESNTTEETKRAINKAKINPNLENQEKAEELICQNGADNRLTELFQKIETKIQQGDLHEEEVKSLVDEIQEFISKNNYQRKAYKNKQQETDALIINLLNYKKENDEQQSFLEKYLLPIVIVSGLGVIIRQATSKIKTRGEIRGSTRKIYRQKGTGGARHGHRYAPQFRGGGVAFGPTGKENYSLKVNAKFKEKVFQSLLSEKIYNKAVIVVDKVKLDNYKTKEAEKFLKILPTKAISKTKVLLILTNNEENKQFITRSFRNLPYVNVSDSKSINPNQLLLSNYLVFTHLALTEGDDNAEQALREVREGITFQKEIIEKFFSQNISNALRKKLNAAYQKAQEAEKIIPELEKLAQEY